jgi:N-acetylglucosaminyl-diphospho-decaprenol L-rhamnosyltransferase
VSTQTSPFPDSPLAEQAADVVIVAFNSGRWLERAVASALAAEAVARVFVIDNASSDGSVQRLAPNPRLVVRRSATNLGFASAANSGWRASEADGASEWILFLNPDCALAPGDVAALIADAYASIGVLSAQLLNSDGSAQRASLRRDPTPVRAIVQNLLAVFARAGWPAHVLQKYGVHIAPPAAAGLVQVDACSGALMLLPRPLVQRLGGFDEGYFLHCEDLDLCRRVRAIGLSVVVDTRVRVIHDKGTSSTAVPRLVALAKHRGMLRYFEKFDAPTCPFWLRGVVYAGAWLRLRFALWRA